MLNLARHNIYLALLEKSQKSGSELSRHLMDVLEVFSAIFYNGAQWVKFPMGWNLKIQNYMVLEICLEIISTKFGWSRSKTNKIKTRDILLIKPIYKLWKMVQWCRPVLNFMLRFRQQCRCFSRFELWKLHFSKAAAEIHWSLLSPQEMTVVFLYIEFIHF